MHRVGEEVQTPRRHHLGIELAQGAGTGVARVGEQRLAALGPLPVDRLEHRIGDQRLAAHLQPGGRIRQLQPQRHALDRAHVGGDLLALLAVAAGGGPHQHAVLIAQGQGVAVDLELAHHRQGRQRFAGGGGAIEHLQQAPVPGLELLEAEGVIEAEQRDAVPHADEAVGRRAAHPLGGAVGAEQLRVGLLELQQFAIEAVIDRVLHQRRVEHVVSVGGAIEEGPQFLGPLALVAGGCGQRDRRAGLMRIHWLSGRGTGHGVGWRRGRCQRAAAMALRRRRPSGCDRRARRPPP